MDKESTESGNISITVTPEFKTLLIESAKLDGRNLSQYIRFTMEKHEAKKKLKARTGRQPTTGE